MGNSLAKEDQRPLLGGEDDDDGFQPLFDQLRFVLLGSTQAGKNTVGNAVFEKRIFTFWSTFNRRCICKTRTVSGRQIHLYRAPGWRGELSQSADIKRELESCVRSSRPHAMLLVINVNAPPTGTTITTLEDILPQLWAHTIVIFTHASKTSCENIRYQFQTLIENCGERYFVFQNHDKITDTIEETVALKRETRLCFILGAPQEPDVHEQLSDWSSIVQRARGHIESISASKEKLLSKYKGLHSTSIRQKLKNKDAEIERLQKIVNDKEREIERLKSTLHGPLQEENRTLQENNATLQEENEAQKRKITALEEEKKTLQEENKAQRRKITALEEEKKALYTKCNTLHDEIETVKENLKRCEGEKRTVSIKLQNVTRKPSNEIELQNFSECHNSTQQDWLASLIDILEELSEDQLKKMKHLMSIDGNVPKASMQDKDRYDLAELIIQTWGSSQSVRKMKAIMIKIPRRDLMHMFDPYLNGHE